MCRVKLPLGTKQQMLTVEKAYLKGEFTPFEEPSSIEQTKSREPKVEPSSENLKLKKRKRSAYYVVGLECKG